ncbi:MAG TPA: ROK family protein [Rikenellaceae bacterium]|nr:ROK family protein [Rikenellaceae bacterium]
MLRQTNSYILPLRVPASEEGKYVLYPSFETDGEVFIGIDSLAEKLSSRKVIVVDGFEGVFWDKFIPRLSGALEKRGLKLSTKDVSLALRPSSEIDALLEPFMGAEDSIFGRMSTMHLVDFFDREALRSIEVDKTADITIVYGTGAWLTGLHKMPDAALVYVDLPKNELQFRMAAGSAKNLGVEQPLESRLAYKRCYFIEWPILDKARADMTGEMDWIVDEQRIDEYTFMSGEALRGALTAMSKTPFRVRPWFAPGVWGGTFLRDNIEGLNKKEKNIAWSYELMAYENGILLSHNGILLETSFSALMEHCYHNILGSCAEVFKSDFPIRFDFLDTIEGGNLSIQCHPRAEYIRSKFGKDYTQDETYYIVKCSPDARVYLGFQDNIDKVEFAAALRKSQEESKALEITDYVQSHPASKHELFLIPNGTIHASGAGNLVLEISSAPYIFTFKMYDWVRLDMDGRPRPINIDHGLANVRFDRKGQVVQDTLISHPYVMEDKADYRKEHVPTHRDHFYDVHRYTLHKGGKVVIDEKDKVHVWMIVEGQHAELITSCGRKYGYNYLETFIVPASAGTYTVVNNGDEDVVLVKAFVKDNFIL